MKIVKDQGNMSAINFSTKLFKIGSWTILKLPVEASAKLPSRGMTMVKGAMNGVPFKTLLEPDGMYSPEKKPSHWFRPDKKLLEDAHAKAGDTVQVSLEVTKEWIEPEVPVDVKKSSGNFLQSRGFMEGDYPNGPLGLDPLGTCC